MTGQEFLTKHRITITCEPTAGADYLCTLTRRFTGGQRLLTIKTDRYIAVDVLGGLAAQLKQADSRLLQRLRRFMGAAAFEDFERLS